MLTFLLTEGVLTVGTISGIFTATLLGSLKTNIIDPLTEQVIPNHKLDITPGTPGTPGTTNIPNTTNIPSTGTSTTNIPSHGTNKENMINILDAGNYNFYDSTQKKIKWQTFLKDLITWIVIMFILYLVWKFLIKNIQK